MIEVVSTRLFADWLGALRDATAKARILQRIDRLRLGNAGDTKPVGEGISEMRVDHGPGFRIYFRRSGEQIVVLLCGGDKSTQDRDIVKARALAREWMEQRS